MCIKIKVSYERPEELSVLLDKLRPSIRTCKKSTKQDGRFKRAYISLNESEIK